MILSFLSVLSAVAAMQITSPTFGDIIHRSGTFTMKWNIDTNPADPAKYWLGYEQVESTWVVKPEIVVFTAQRAQVFPGSIFPAPGQYSVVVYKVGGSNNDVPAYASSTFTVV